MAIEIEHESTYRTVMVCARLAASSDVPPDVPKRYSTMIIRPDTVRCELTYREQAGQWEISPHASPEVSGRRVLKGGRLSQVRSGTLVNREVAPWAWEWVECLLNRLNDMEVAKLPASVSIG